jgi:hypothetical protein
MAKKRMIYCPGPDRWITIGQYVAIIRKVKSLPLETEYPQTFCSWAGGNGHKILREFWEGIQDRINQAVPYKYRGMTNS